MAEGLNSIITQLEQQLSAIDKALVALRDVAGSGAAPAEAPAAETPSRTSPGTRKSRISPEGKRRLIAALKKRWAEKKAAASMVEVAPRKTTSSKSGMTEDGRRRLAEAMKRRWAVKRAASHVKKRGTKKAA